MSAAFDRFLAAIEALPDEALRVVDQGFNTAPAIPALIEDWEAYRQWLAVFYCHIECALLGIRAGRPPDIDMDVHRCCLRLNRRLGESALKAGFEIARTGNEGGMQKLLRQIAVGMAQEWVEKQIALSVTMYWAGSSAEELLRDCDSYLGGYGHLLPSELTEGSAARIRVDFRKVLRQHPWMMRQMRTVGRT